MKTSAASRSDCIIRQKVRRYIQNIALESIFDFPKNLSPRSLVAQAAVMKANQQLNPDLLLEEN